jgi:co-chaperonin GroES (HSP10)
MRVLRDNILVKKLEREQLGKIVLPDSVQDEWSRGEVYGVGPGVYSYGKLIKPDIKVGDIVIFPSQQMGMSLPPVGDNELLIIPEKMILAIEEAV